MYDTETLYIDGVSNKEIFMETSCRKYAAKASPRPRYNFGFDPKQPLHARNSLKGKIFWKRIIKKP